MRFSYAGDPVLRGISLEIEDGEVVAITGASGSGKTTLLNILGLVTRPSSGSVRATAGSSSLAARDFGWVLQTANVIGRRSALSNVSMGAYCLGVGLDEATSIARKLLTRVGIESLAHKRADTLSGGELQRVCIARSIAGSPAVLLADEPTGQLDRSTSELVLDSLLAVRDPHLTVVFATHDQFVANRCGRVLEIVDGTIVEPRR